MRAKKRSKTMVRAIAVSSLIAVIALGSFPPPAAADEAEPSIIATAWYWEPQRNEEQTTPVGNVSVELPNPFCPAIPGQLGAPPDTCAEGRLPVEVVNGDYETPDKVSAVAFDLSAIPVGSEVLEFSVTLLEAETGCYKKESAESDRQCEVTDARNAEDKRVQACLVTQIFGEGEARPYKELPRFQCSKDDPVATRKEIKNDAKSDPDDTDPDHVWKFDLTTFAQDWVEEFTASTSVMLRPKPPKGEAEGQGDDVDWRVVFAGPRFPGGVATHLEFEPPEDTGIDPIDPTEPSDPFDGSGTADGFDATGSDVTTDAGSDLGVGGTETSTPATGGDAIAETPVDAGGESDQEQASQRIEGEPIPPYVWLAVLAGLIGFSVVRSLVLERTVGHRPNGVLAQIHRLNVSRRGAEGAAAAAGTGVAGGALSALREGAASVTRSLKPLAAKLSSVPGKVAALRRR